MDVFSHFSDPVVYISDTSPFDVPEVQSASVSSTARPGNFSDEEPTLASRHPKKRAGRKKFRETRHPVFRGVRRRNTGKWVCEVREPNKKSRIWLGTFPTVEMAARAHDVAAIALRGKNACLNFADSAWRLQIPATGDTKDIQKAAAEAAEEFRPREASNDDVAAAPEVEEVFYMDEEAVFGMPGLLTSMAEAMLMSPPRCVETADVDEDADVSLWSYSI